MKAMIFPPLTLSFLALCAAFCLSRAVRADEQPSQDAGRVICRDSDRYAAWPSVACLKDGRTLVAAFSGDRLSHVCPSGKVEVIRSTDGGKTWSKPAVVGDTSIDDRDAGVHCLPNGEVLVTWFTSVAYVAHPYWKKQWGGLEKRPVDELMKFCGRWCVRSADGGKTWTRPERMSVVGSTPHGGIVLKDGSLLWVGRTTPGKNNEALAAGDLPTAICCERSADGGRTWEMLCERFPDVDGEGRRNHLFHEPHVAELPDGRLVALIRCHAEDGCFRRSESRDGGRTWSPMVRTTLKAGETAPHLMALPAGRLVATYGLRRQDSGRRIGVGEFAAFSSDGGLTWSETEGFCLHRSPKGCGAGEMGYPATVLLADGSLYTVFYEPERTGGKPCIWGVNWRAP